MLQSFESFAGRYGFAKVAPLLADVAAVEEGGLVSVTATPDKMEVPSERMTVRVEPLRSLQPPSLPSKGVPKRTSWILPCRSTLTEDPVNLLAPAARHFSCAMVGGSKPRVVLPGRSSQRSIEKKVKPAALKRVSDA